MDSVEIGITLTRIYIFELFILGSVDIECLLCLSGYSAKNKWDIFQT